MVLMKRLVQMRIIIIEIVLLLLLFMKMMKNSSAQTHRILVDTDMDTDDVFALFYLLKQDQSEFNLQAISINSNGWSDGGHGVNHLYDMLFMMGRDDIPVGVGGEGSIFPNSTFSPNLGGYLPIIDQGISTAGGCRYRQSIPVGRNGRLDVDSNFGLRKSFLPQGERRYIPLEQPTAQQVMKEAISRGPNITIFLMGSHTNLAIFLMTNPELKRNIDHIYAMGGSVGSTSSSSNNNNDDNNNNIGNLFPQDTNPFAEFNIFADPFAAYTVLHSGIPITLVPLDATKTIPVDENFFSAFEKKQDTYEAQYCFQSLKMARDTWISADFYKQYCMWDSFMVGVALSQMRNSRNNYNNDEIISNNEFAWMEYVNITVVTSNEPYGISDGSNPLNVNDSSYDGNNLMSKFDFGVNNKSEVHSGHVQTGMRDNFCLVQKRGKCQDGYTKRVSGEEGVRVLIAKEAKPNSYNDTSLTKQFYKSFLDFMNRPAQSGRFNITTQFPYYKNDIPNAPRFGKQFRGKPVVFDMDMSAGDILALYYLLKLPVELVDIKGIMISGSGWANAATIDVAYDILHMMGRNDISVGLGDVFAIGQSFPDFSGLGDCAFSKFIPRGAGGFLDSDTLYGLARYLPHSPRMYRAENSKKFGAPRDTDHPELRQPSALDVWKSVVNSLNQSSKVTLLTNGPLTNLAQIISISHNTTSMIQDVYVVGGLIDKDNEVGNNMFTVPLNKEAEFNMFLDPLAAKMVLDSKLSVTIIPLCARKQLGSFDYILQKLKQTNKTPELEFVQLLLQTLKHLQEKDKKYFHMDAFLGEILGAVVLANENESQLLDLTFEYKFMKVLADNQGNLSRLGEIIVVDESEQGKKVKVLKSVNPMACFDNFVNLLGDQRQSAMIASFDDQKRIWNEPPKRITPIIYQVIEVNMLLGSIVLICCFGVSIRNKVIGK